MSRSDAPHMMTSWRAKALRALIFPCAPALLCAAPVPSRILFPPHTTTSEQVVVSIHGNEAQVTGRYSFRVSPDAPQRWLRRPFRLSIQMPVPVPRSLGRFDEIEAATQPVITVKGQTYRAEKGVFHYNVFSLPTEAKLAIFLFRVERDDLGNEFEIVMQYRQPAISTGGRDMVYYVPFLPTLDRDATRLGLNADAYRVRFESEPNQPIQLARDVSHLVETGPQIVMVQPKHMELIAVETRATLATRSPAVRLPAAPSPVRQ